MPITAKGVSHVYRRGEPGEIRALDGVDLTIFPGEFVLLAGANGSGKTTLLQCMSGLMRPTRGGVSIDGTAALSIQFPERALFARTVHDDVAFGPLNMGMKKGDALERAIEAIKTVGLESSLLGRDPRRLSHGQKRLAALAGVIASRPDYLFLDEPTAGLDPAAKELVIEALIRLNRGGMAIVAGSHDLSHFMGACRRMLVLGHGKIAFDGRPCELILRDDIDEMGLALPPSLVAARWLRLRGIEAPWDISPEDAARRIHEDARMD
jgi:energy-coupling factor transport system ATP-binding protein